jgi:IS5 family transposase
MPARWKPAVELTKQEQFILKRLGKVRTLMPFLRRRRHELFDEAFQAELDAMYRRSGAGKEAVPPALMAMATLLQGYLNVSDAMMVELTTLDLSVQCVLGCLGSEGPAFSQGAFHDFRTRLIAHGMDQRLLERTVELARNTGDFDAKKLPKSLRIAIDSSPLEGAARVEDTLNLLGHAGRDIARCVAKLLERPYEDVCEAAGATLLSESSVKKGLDLDWTQPGVRDEGLRKLLDQLDRLVAWVKKQVPESVSTPPLSESLATLEQLKAQDLEPDPNSPGGGSRIKHGVAKERRVSITDKEMRHGRKNKNKLINGYKRHLAADVDTKLIHAVAVTPANMPEQFAAPVLKQAIESNGFSIAELYIDRGYLSSEAVEAVLAEGGEVICRPWTFTKRGYFSKLDFEFDLKSDIVTCPAGVPMPFREGFHVRFPAELCDVCPLRAKCTSARKGRGRDLDIADDERFFERLRRNLRSQSGRARLRRRTGIEHRLAHLSRRNGTRARYRGVRKNEFALRRSSAVLNLEVLNFRQTRGTRSLSNRSVS